MTSLLIGTVGKRDELVLDLWLLRTADVPERWLRKAIESALDYSKWSPTIAELRARVASEVIRSQRHARGNDRLAVDLDQLVKEPEKVDRYIAMARAIENMKPVSPTSAPIETGDFPSGWEERLQKFFGGHGPEPF